MNEKEARGIVDTIVQTDSLGEHGHNEYAKGYLEAIEKIWFLIQALEEIKRVTFYKKSAEANLIAYKALERWEKIK